MWQQFKSWTNKPYKLIENLYIKFSMIFGVGIFTYVFLSIFQPYGIHKVIEENHWLITGYGTIVSFCLFISYYILPKIFPHFFKNPNWNIGKEISFLLSIFLIISTLSYFYHNYFVAIYLTEFSYLKFISIALSIAIFPIVLIIFIVERYFYKKNMEPIKYPQTFNNENKKLVTIPSDNLKEQPLIIEVNQILFAQSNNNYTTIFTIKNNQLQQELLRITLKKVENILKEHSELVRCHRSFLINKNHILKIEGNLRSLKIHLRHTSHIIPVSRTFSKDKLTN